MLNRAALIVRPAEPFIEWARSLDDSGVLPDPSGEQSVYLVPEYDVDEEAESVLRLVHREVFERELQGWHTVEEDWPSDRSLAAFKRWFQIEMHTVIEDLLDSPLEDIE